MAKVIHCGGKYSNAKFYRLPSSKQAYAFEHCQHGRKCASCGQEFMTWRGEYQSGTFTPWYDVPKQEQPIWHRRIQAGEAKPEAQLMSEWSERAGKPADVAMYYHNTIQLAKRWWKGNKI